MNDDIMNVFTAMHNDFMNVMRETHNRIAELVALKALDLSTKFTTEDISSALFGGEENGKIPDTQA